MMMMIIRDGACQIEEPRLGAGALECGRQGARALKGVGQARGHNLVLYGYERNQKNTKHASST